MGIIRNEFEKKNRLSLKELYAIVSKNPDVTMADYNLNHRIRSALYALQKSNKIKRVEPETYEKI